MEYAAPPGDASGRRLATLLHHAPVVSTRVFLLSPASCAGRRAELLLGGRGTFELAERLRSGAAVPLGEAFSFLSGLYFRGKLAYARAFAAPPPGAAPVHVITTNRGLLSPDEPVTAADLAAFGSVPIDLADPRYREPLHADATALASALPADTGRRAARQHRHRQVRGPAARRVRAGSCSRRSSSAAAT
jgi:hypothetical protein